MPMPNDSATQQALANDVTFRRRVRSAMSTVAWQVQGEDVNTPNHQSRVNYADFVIRQLDSEVNAILPSLVFRPLVFNFETTYVYDFPLQTGAVVSAAGDLDLQSQLVSDWDDLAAAAGFKPPVTPP